MAKKAPQRPRLGGFGVAICAEWLRRVLMGEQSVRRFALMRSYCRTNSVSETAQK